MSKYVYMMAKIMAVAFIVSLVYFSFFSRGYLNRNPSKINTNVYYAFQQIYHDCKTLDYSNRTRDCRVVMDIFNRCRKGELSCTVGEYYRFLDNLGYKLPPFYMDD